MLKRTKTKNNTMPLREEYTFDGMLTKMEVSMLYEVEKACDRFLAKHNQGQVRNWFGAKRSPNNDSVTT